MEFISLKFDYAFRTLFTRERVRKQFISDVTGIPLESIRSTRLESPFLWKLRRRQKQGILDVAVRLYDGTRIDIEMQVRFQKYWTKRNLFYLAKMYTEELWAGDAYERLKKCITISLLDFVLTPDTGCHSVYTLRDKNGREFSDLFEVHIIELRKPSVEAGAIGEWIQLFNAGSMEELDMIKTKNAGILEAREVLRTLNLSNPLRRMYEMHLKAVRDRQAEDAYVRDLGRAEGRIEGKAEGRIEGKAEGRIEGKVEGRIEGKVEGRIEGRINLVCRKLAKGKTPEAIADDLEEDLKEVQRICDAAAKYAPDYDIEKILKEYLAEALPGVR